MSFSSFLCRHLARVLVLVVVGGGSLVGCSSFGSSESAAAPDSGNPPPAPPDAGEADAGLDGGDAGDECAVLFRDNFDASQTFDPMWTVRGSGVRIVMESLSEPYAMGADVRQGEPISYIEAAVGTHSRVVAAARVNVIQKGEGEVDLFNLVPESSSNRPLAFVHSQPLGKFAFQLPNADGSGNDVVPAALEVGGWHLIKIDLDMRTKQVRCEVDDEFVVVRELPAQWKPGALTLKLGAVYVKDVGAPFALRFDDVHVRACD